MFDILILWKNSKLNTLSIEISNNCKADISSLFAEFSSKITPKPYIKTLISNNRSHDIENRVIVTHHNRSIDPISKISNLQTISNLRLIQYS